MSFIYTAIFLCTVFARIVNHEIRIDGDAISKYTDNDNLFFFSY